MRLHKLLSKVGGAQRTHTEMDPEVCSLEYDSRRLQNDSVFFALSGEVTDGHLYIDEAVQRGASAVASERKAPPGFPLPWIQVPSVRPFLAAMAQEFYGRPSEKLRLVGVTGTNGKTTTAFLVQSILSQHSPALLMGTVKTLLGDEELESELTTPEAVDVQKRLALALARGCRWGAVEASSHALFLHRLYQCRFPVAVFTNLTRDHLDFHTTLENYFQAKRLLFQHYYNPDLQYAVVNADDRFSSRISTPPAVRVVRFGFSTDSHVYPTRYHTALQETAMDLNFLGRRLSLKSSLAGRHNSYNIMAAAAASSLLGIPDDQIREGVARLRSVPGRFEKLETSSPFTVIVDYAHTPDALENVLKLCTSLRPNRILCLFGCGGDRDRTKRPVMGAITVRYAHLAIITSDNPRFEPPERIIEEIRAGIPNEFSNYETILDRRKAIARILQLARKGDIVLLAGKGHETYQEIDGKKIPFDDRKVVTELL